MRRFFILIFLLFLVLPAVINIAGCSSNKSAAYCNNVGYGPKRTDIATINLEPKITGISLAYGQMQQIGAATAFSCPPAETIGVSSFTYGSTNFQMVDISPTGNLCGGTWNRNSAGGTPDFTICTPPKGSELDPRNPGYFPGGVVQITASAGGATSNTVAVYVHPRISSISIPTQQACVSQNQVLKDAAGNVLPLSQETIVKDDLGNVINSQYVGNLTFAPVDTTIVSIDPTGIATAKNPGSTAITATLSQSSSAAGYFYTCPPASISAGLGGWQRSERSQGCSAGYASAAHGHHQGCKWLHSQRHLRELHLHQSHADRRLQRGTSNFNFSWQFLADGNMPASHVQFVSD